MRPCCPKCATTVRPRRTNVPGVLCWECQVCVLFFANAIWEVTRRAGRG